MDEAVLTSTHNLRFWAETRKISDFFLSEHFQFLVVKFSIYLNRRVFVMDDTVSILSILTDWPVSQQENMSFKNKTESKIPVGKIETIMKTRLFKYIENITAKNWKFSDKKLWYFSYFCSKHRLWVLVRTASLRRFSRVPTIFVLSRNKKNKVYPCKPQFYYIKVGFKGSKLYRHVFMTCAKFWRSVANKTRTTSATYE